MEIEYSNEVGRHVFAYRFSSWEKQLIAKCLKPEIPRIKRKIKKIENNPKNEGQATYSEAIKELRAEIDSIEAIIEEFKES